MLNLLADAITPIEPGLMDTLQANYAIVAGAVTTFIASLGATWLIIKGGLKGIGTLLAKKKEDGDASASTLTEKLQNLKTLTIRKGQLEVNKSTCETIILNNTLKLDVITKPESRELIENTIAIKKAELAGIVKELEEVDKQLPSLNKLIA
jgi:hypothetical protein